MGDEDVKALMQLSDENATFCLRSVFLEDCFHSFSILCNIITVAATLKNRYTIYKKLFSSMIANSPQRSIKSNKSLVKKNDKEDISVEKCFDHIRIKFTEALQGLRSFSNQFLGHSDEELLSLLVIFDVNRHGWIYWNDLCLLGEMIYDSFRKDPTHPTKAYTLLYRSILQSISSSSNSLLPPSFIEKLNQLTKTSKELGLRPLLLLEQFDLGRKKQQQDQSVGDGADNFVHIALIVERLTAFVRVHETNLLSIPSPTLPNKASPRSSSKWKKVADSNRFLKNASLLMTSR